jgi:transposase
VVECGQIPFISSFGKGISVLRPRDRQRSFYDAESVCERLIPRDSFYRKFKEIVWPLIEDEQFEVMYCKDNGRPSIPPALLAMATILQFYRNLSDREMERACMYDIEIKYALGLKLDDRPFDHSSLGDFRKRLLDNGKEKEIFNRLLEQLVKAGLIEKNEIQRIDATHIIADIALPTMVVLVKKGIYEILKHLEKSHESSYKGIGEKINLQEYSKQKVNQEDFCRLDMERKKKKLVQVVNDARKVLEHIKEIKDDGILNKDVEMLKRILRENIEEDAAGVPKERGYKNKPDGILVSPVDPDARYGAKSEKKRFTGYKTNITETVKSRFITNIIPMHGNRHDGKTFIEAIKEQREHDIVPAKVIGDAAYGDGLFRKELKPNGTEVVAPIRNKNDRTMPVYPKNMFRYDEVNQTVTCPAGVTTKETSYDRRTGIKVFHFPMSVCGQCDRKKECTRSKEGRRTVSISRVDKEIREAEQYNLTEQFKREMKLRSPIEGKLSELTRYHGLRRARYRGLRKLGLQCYFTAAAVNLKRWVKVMLERMRPRVPEVVPV